MGIWYKYRKVHKDTFKASFNHIICTYSFYGHVSVNHVSKLLTLNVIDNTETKQFILT